MSMGIWVFIKARGITYKNLDIVDNQVAVKKCLTVHTHHYVTWSNVLLGYKNRGEEFSKIYLLIHIKSQVEIVVASMALHNYIRRWSQDDEVFSEYDRNPNFIPDDFLPDIVPPSAIQRSQRPSCIDFVWDGIANSLMGQWKTFINVQGLFILLCNHNYKTTIFCQYIYNIFLSNFTIKPHTKNILTKHNTLFFFQP